jgi:Domain of unknown function (DUF4178)
MVGAAAPAVRGFNCRNCGAAVALRALHHTRAVVCTSCGAILDPRDPNVCVLQKAAWKEFLTPEIPLGTRGTLHDQPWEVVGFQRRSIEVEGVSYAWQEYVLFNPYRGFRYLSNYEGHWNYIETVRQIPEPRRRGTRPDVRYQGDIYRHFQSAIARTDYVVGEFPWRVRTGEPVEVADYICPPRLLSSERTENETTWSIGTYTDAGRIWQAFALPGAPPTPPGVFANQPSPHAQNVPRTFRAFFVLAAVVVLSMLGRLVTADREPLIAGSYVYQPQQPESAFVTEPFTMGKRGTVEIAFKADLREAWLALDVALINAESGTAWNVARELGYYSGRDGDGPWTEDNRRARLLLPAVPAGEYYLRVEPEGAIAGPPVPYTIEVRRDVPSLVPYAVALALLIVPPVLVAWRSSWFERQRMAESDHAG